MFPHFASLVPRPQNLRLGSVEFRVRYHPKSRNQKGGIPSSRSYPKWSERVVVIRTVSFASKWLSYVSECNAIIILHRVILCNTASEKNGFLTITNSVQAFKLCWFRLFLRCCYGHNWRPNQRGSRVGWFGHGLWRGECNFKSSAG